MRKHEAIGRSVSKRSRGASWLDLSRLGFGLWRVPVASIILEAVILLVGVWLYWRTARSGSRSRGRVSPGLVSLTLLACGVIVLLLDAFGI